MEWKTGNQVRNDRERERERERELEREREREKIASTINWGEKRRYRAKEEANGNEENDLAGQKEIGMHRLPFCPDQRTEECFLPIGRYLRTKPRHIILHSTTIWTPETHSAKIVRSS